MKKTNNQLFLPVECVKAESLTLSEASSQGEISRAKVLRPDFGNKKNERNPSTSHAKKCMAFYKIFAGN